MILPVCRSLSHSISDTSQRLCLPSLDSVSRHYEQSDRSVASLCCVILGPRYTVGVDSDTVSGLDTTWCHVQARYVRSLRHDVQWAHNVYFLYKHTPGDTPRYNTCNNAIARLLLAPQTHPPALPGLPTPATAVAGHLPTTQQVKNNYRGTHHALLSGSPSPAPQAAKAALSSSCTGCFLSATDQQRYTGADRCS